MSQQVPNQPGPPYAPKTAVGGGVVSVIPDIPISAVLMAIYVGFAATNLTIFRINQKRGHKFIISIMIFGFCVARITTLVLRVVLATRHTNIRLNIAANIFVYAGILLIYIINVLFAQRILRAKQPRVGWHTALRIFYRAMYFGIAAALIMVIIALVLTLYSLNPNTLRACRDIQLTAVTYMLVFATTPLFVLATAYILPSRSADEETFGQGSMGTKVIILLLSTCLSVLNAGFKAGTNWESPRPANNPAWYHSKAAFYVFNFALEIIILFTLTVGRVDKRFHIPNGSKKPGDYSTLYGQAPSEKRETRSENETAKDVNINM
ncbi:hypothetical protein F4779DRAFT_588824 [Xylariaceae sp. FL0662B]|nr:hypothetical protein F4779DRAFT_588824 [Xylariaceae sp. FL0662B]